MSSQTQRIHRARVRSISMPPKFSSFEPLYPKKLRGAQKVDLLSKSFSQFFSLEIQFPGQKSTFAFSMSYMFGQLMM